MGGQAGPHTSDGSHGFFVEMLSGLQVIKTMFGINGPRMEVAVLGCEVSGPVDSPYAAGCEEAWKQWDEMVWIRVLALLFIAV